MPRAAQRVAVKAPCSPCADGMLGRRTLQQQGTSAGAGHLGEGNFERTYLHSADRLGRLQVKVFVLGEAQLEEEEVVLAVAAAGNEVLVAFQLRLAVCWR